MYIIYKLCTKLSILYLHRHVLNSNIYSTFYLKTIVKNLGSAHRINNKCQFRDIVAHAMTFTRA